jgi:hypothetical protein
MKRLLAILTVVLSATPAAAELSAKQLLEMLAVPNNDSAKLYLRGLHHGFSWSNTVLKSHKQPMLYCEPDKITLADEQALDIMRRHVEKDPSLGTYPAPMILITALQQALPCTPSKLSKGAAPGER